MSRDPHVLATVLAVLCFVAACFLIFNAEFVYGSMFLAFAVIVLVFTGAVK